jgi:hypothetical protein
MCRLIEHQVLSTKQTWSSTFWFLECKSSSTHAQYVSNLALIPKAALLKLKSLLKTILWIENNQIILPKKCKILPKTQNPPPKNSTHKKKNKKTLNRETKFCGGKNRIPKNLTRCKKIT